MPLFEHTVPEGELGAGETYRVEIGYDRPAPLTEIYYRTESFNITTRGSQDKTAKQGQSKGEAHTIVIDGRASSGGTDYTISGGGRLAQVDGELNGHRVSLQGNDVVSGSRARGHVAGAKDGFMVYGPIPRVELRKPANAVVYVDGERQ